MDQKQNMKIYDAVSTTPESAKKTIRGGRLNGFTDINPMYRIKTLTEQFGPAGIGWSTTTLERWVDETSTGEVIANVRIALKVKTEEGWSEPIEGCGGSMLVAKERNGLRASDEAWKMAQTDALSVCCKALGIGADVYWEKGATKYSQPEQPEPVQIQPEPEKRKPGVVGVSKTEIKTFQQHCAALGEDYKAVMKKTGWNSSMDWNPEFHGRALCILRDLENANAS